MVGANTERKGTQTFQWYAWGVLVYHVAVIIWGAFVRATGSGAGCGQHWPLCNGTAVPHSPTLATIIEFTHRVTSGLALTLALGLVAFAFWKFPRRHLARRAATSVIFFEFMEALIGAALVLLGQTAKDTSTGRVYTLSIHLVNTLLLVGALTITAWAGGKFAPMRRETTRGTRWTFGLACIGILVLGVSGAIVALGDTLFHSASLSAGFALDFSPAAHPLVRLRIWHPALAAVIGAGLMALSFSIVRKPESRSAERLAYGLGFIVLLQWAVGVINLGLLAPVALQLIHLFLADALWIAFVLLSAEVLLTSPSPAADPAVETADAFASR